MLDQARSLLDRGGDEAAETFDSPELRAIETVVLRPGFDDGMCQSCGGPPDNTLTWDDDETGETLDCTLCDFCTNRVLDHTRATADDARPEDRRRQPRHRVDHRIEPTLIDAGDHPPAGKITTVRNPLDP